MKRKHDYAVLIVLMIMAAPLGVVGADWPMWRCDAARSGQTVEQLPETLHLQWVRQYPPLVPAYSNPRLQFDAGYEPVVLGKTMFVASSHNDSVTALDVDTGQPRWRFFADGPVRLAPAAWQDNVYFGSDDGQLYCVSADSGQLRWKFRAVPSNRKVLGNRRLISLWPLRGGPVLANGVVYFAAGVWPFEGVFVYALDAETGQVVWLNDRAGYVYGQHPHAAEAFGGLTPQGYLAISGDELIVPCGSALPARFDPATGRLVHFELPKDGRLPGGWFVASKAVRRGEEPPGTREIVFDKQVNRDRHEGGWNDGPGGEKVRTTITAENRTISFDEPVPEVEGDVHTMLLAGGKLVVVTRRGAIYCFGSQERTPKFYPLEKTSSGEIPGQRTPHVQEVFAATGTRHGYALVWGVGSGRLIEALAEQSDLNVIAVDPDQGKVDRLRGRLDAAGWYGPRVSVHRGNPLDFGFPPYLASLIVSEDLTAAGFPAKENFVARLFDTLRPHGGAACLAIPADNLVAFQRQLEQAKLAGARLTRHGALMVLTRDGPLPGSANYTGGWTSPDQLVKAPLGVLWFDDSVGHFKRAPQPMFVDGVMISHDKSWLGWVDGDRPPYALTEARYTDVYTGRVMSRNEPGVADAFLPTRDVSEKQPEQYRPPQQKDPWKPEPPVAGRRVNPLTGAVEPRAILKSYGCDGGNDYGYLYTMRSGTAAFYDKRNESGVVHISGPRSGCTNSVIPACGLLNVPYFYQGCTCSYPLPVGLALTSMPQEFEQWTVWGKSQPGPVQRVGINFGAPGDRMTEEGTLWLDYPSVGGPSPDVAVNIEPAGVEYYYRHSLWIKSGRGWPWVVASGVKGARSMTINGLKSGNFTVRLYFAEPDEIGSGRRVLDISLQGQPVLQGWDIVREAGGRMRGIVKQFGNIAADGSLKLELAARAGETLISGIELVAAHLEPGPIPALAERGQ